MTLRRFGICLLITFGLLALYEVGPLVVTAILWELQA